MREMAQPVRVPRYSTVQARQMILDLLENDSDSDISPNDSGTDYDDHISEVSEHSDEEVVDVAHSQACQDTASSVHNEIPNT